MAEESKVEFPIQRIRVRVKTGSSRMSGSDDPLFLGLTGASGREFRLKLAKGRALRRRQEDLFVLGAPDDPETNIDEAEFNDPTHPALACGEVASVYLRKGFEPIPNVRGVGEMDDRIELIEAEVDIYAEGRPKPVRHRRRGPIWLGLISGTRLEIPRVDDGE